MLRGWVRSEKDVCTGGSERESGYMKIDDEEAGIRVEIEVRDVPEGTVAKRLASVFELVEYHRFQSQRGKTDE